MTTTKQATTEQNTNKDKDNCGLNNNSFIPMLKECERFIKFLNKRFALNLPQNYVITINKASKNTRGYFMPIEHSEHYTNTTQDLKNINLNTLYLKDNKDDKGVYECLAHELAHLLNDNNKIKDCSSNQYHNKHFKTQAEKLLLIVEKTNKGYSSTKEGDEFKQMLKEYNPNIEVFNIIQNIKERKDKKPSRLRKYMCDCGIIVRVASDNFKAQCLLCEGDFIKC